MTYKTTEETFLRDVEHHKLTVLMDNGVYRHLRFSRDKSIDMYFELITGPNYLLYRGDMGCYEFERLTDMFSFFRNKQSDSLYINPCYWSEKLQACCIYSNYKVFDNDTLQELIKELRDDFTEDYLDEEGKEEFNDECESHFQTHYDNMHDAYIDASEFNFNDKNPFQDIFIDSAPEVFSSHFIWACYAIVWGIQQYDKQTTNEEKQ
jgi:hypothetical protein